MTDDHAKDRRNEARRNANGAGEADETGGTGGADEAAEATATAILSTEHFVLQSARSAATSEAVSRVSIFLTAVSAALVAAAFLGQLPDPSVVTAFGLIVVAALVFLGATTFERVLQVSIEDFQFALRINRIRRFYVRRSALAAEYLEPPAEEGVGALLASYGVRSGDWQMLVSLAGVVSFVNGLLVAVLAGLVLSTIGVRETLVSGIVALAVFVGVVWLQTLRQRRRRSGWHRIDSRNR
jgi:hypothetical protein